MDNRTSTFDVQFQETEPKVNSIIDEHTDRQPKTVTSVTTADGQTKLVFDESAMQPHPASCNAEGALIPSDAITREWFVFVSEECRTYHVTVADYTSVCPESPRIVIGVDGKRWPVQVNKQSIATQRVVKGTFCD